MSKLLKNTTIQSAEFALSDQVNFQYLKQLGLDAIIRSASEKWTDYNEHDPGITILEVLVYALTDLGYRTDFSIEDILAQEKLPLHELAKNQFYTANKILSINPVSFKDYRRLIADIDGVENAWVLPLDDSISPFEGLIEIWVDVDLKIKKEAERKALRQEIKKNFFRHRNLSQDLSRIVFRKPLELSFKMELVLDPKKVKDVEKELAKVLLEIQEYISEKLYFLSLEQMMVLMDGDVNAIFNGPELKHGFLPEESLKPMVKELNVIKLIPIIQKTEGVVMISDLKFRTSAKSKQWLTKIDIKAAERMVLGAVLDQELTVMLGDTPYKVDQQNFKFEYDKLLNQQAKSKLAIANRDLPIAIGDYRDMESYFSIQNEFPTIYGLEPVGPPPDASRNRLAQIEQLKSYLLIFDQIMANYLAQLSHLSRLFSWDKDIKQTYFFQGLTGAVASLENLLVDPSEMQNPSTDVKEIMAHYLGKLAKFTEDKSTFLERRNRFLDHLLARFGRQLTIGNHNLKAELISLQELQEAHEIKGKQTVLENYPYLSSDRGRAFNLEAKEFAKEFSGLRNWVETLFFMDPENIEKYRFNQRFKVANYKSKSAHPSPLFDQSEFIFVTQDRTNKIDLAEIMRIGTNSENYSIDYKEKIGYRILLFKQTDILKVAKVYEIDKKFKTPEKALEVIEDLVKLLQHFDRTSESVYILEHLLMRPMPNERYFGLELLDKDQQIWLTTKQWYSKNSLDVMQQPLRLDQFSFCIKGKTVCSKIFKKKSRKPKRKIEAKFVFKLNEKKNEFGEMNYQICMRYYANDEFVKFKSNKLFATEALAIKSINDWMKRYEQKMTRPNDKDVIFKALLSPWCKAVKKKRKPTVEQKQECLNIDPYSNILTAVLPKWPSRFQEEGFKNRLSQTLQEEAPSHLWINILWLDKDKFQRFQKLFGRWWNAYVANDLDAYCYREKIMNFILKESYEDLTLLQ